MSELQFDNPNAPNYDWQRDREWFNQRLAKANLENHALRQRIANLRAPLQAIAADKMTKPQMRDTAKAAIAYDNANR